MDIPVAEVVAWTRRSKLGLAIGAGVALRLAGYLTGRPYWMDEGSLAANITSLTPSEFFGPLRGQQLATPGFLLATWSAVQLLGDNIYAMRLVPLAGGIASVFLFLAVSRRVLPPRAVFPAALMFAVASDPVYYASEIKQYSTDLAAGLAILLAALRMDSRPWPASRAALVAAGGAAILWFSHPSAFVLAGVGLIGLARSVAARDRRGIVAWCVVGATWAASLAVVHAVAIRQLAGSGQMWLFWDFAFPPIPPRSPWDATWVARRLAYYFINPLNFDSPFGERLSMIPALGLAALGVFRLWKLDRARWALLTLPIALTLLAASLKLYPFHGRLVLFLAPAFLLAVAAGLDAVRERWGRGWAYRALAAMVLLVPTLSACGRAVDPYPNHNRFGDLHPDARIDPYRFPL